MINLFKRPSVRNCLILFALTVGISARAQNNEIDRCSNETYQISVRSLEGFLTALLMDNKGSLLAQYQIHFDETVNNYIGQGFSLRTLSDPESPAGRYASFNATLALTGGNAYGQLICEPHKVEPEHPGKPSCHGMQMPHYFNGSWHCLGGGH